MGAYGSGNRRRFLRLICGLMTLCGTAFSCFAADVPDLQQAAAAGDLPGIRNALAAKADPNAADVHGITPAMRAVMFPGGSLAGLKLLVEQGANLNPLHPVYGGVLATALEFFRQELEAGKGKMEPVVLARREEVFEYLLSHGADVNGVGQYGFTPLIFAAAYRQHGLFDLFLHHGADVNAMDDRGGTPLIRAILPFYADKPDLTLVDTLLAHGANPNIGNLNPLCAGGMPSTLKAAMIGRLGGNYILYGSQTEMRALVAKLMAHGAIFPVHAQDAPRQALLLAATAGNLEKVKQLLASGVKPDAMDNREWTPMMSAAALGYTDIMHALLDAGADDNAADDSNIFPLWLSVSNDPDQANVEWLLSKDATAGATTSFWGPPLLAAVARRDEKLVKAMLDQDAAPNLSDADLHLPSPLLQATLNNSPGIVNLLLQYGAEPNTVGDDGRAPLFWAVTQDEPEITKALIDGGADVNAMDKQGVSILSLARAPRRNPQVRKLVEDAAASSNSN